MDEISPLDPPLPWEQDSSTEFVFAWLTPFNKLARRSFDLVVEGMITNPNTHLHEREFIHVSGKSIPRPASVSGSDDEADQEDQEETDQSQYVGAFKFSTTILPKEPTMGWFIGTGYRKPEVDVVIGPFDSKSKHNNVLGKHARLYIHKESCQTTVEALHSMEVSGSTGLKHLGQKGGSSTKVLEHGHLIQFGQCTYLFEHGKAIRNGNFHNGLDRFMHLHYDHQWKAHPILSAPSTAAYLTLDEYTFLPGAFAGGSFGEVTAGWAQDGSAVAIKRFKEPDENKLNQHMDIMRLIGKHANVLKLLHVSSNLELAFPAIYCVYSPLALASLEDVLSSHRLNLAAQIALLIDYLRGLVYLHDSKGIMHRDIKPGNLGVLSFSPFAGILLDLDAATTDTRSDDHGQGTITYLAPEIINLKLDSTEEREKYGSQADVWALGMSAFFALTGRHVWWNDFADEWDEWPKGSSLPNTKDTNFVLKDRLARFHHSYEQKKPQNIYFRQYFDLLKPMTAYKPVHRHSASEALGIAEKLAKEWGEAKMFARESTQGIKRKIGEI